MSLSSGDTDIVTGTPDIDYSILRDKTAQRNVASHVIKEVEKMISQAKVDSEIKVKNELVQMQKETVNLAMKLEKLITATKTNKPTVDLANERKLVADFAYKIEEQWMTEMTTLKQELHQTILAHNHNADLMKQLKDGMDHIHTQIDDKHSQHHDEQWSRYLPRLEEIMRRCSNRDRQIQTITPRMDGLLLRLESLEAQIVQIPPFAAGNLASSQWSGSSPPLKIGSAPANGFNADRWGASVAAGPRGNSKDVRKEAQNVGKQNNKALQEKEMRDDDKRGDLRAAAPVFVPKASDETRKSVPIQPESESTKPVYVGAPPGLPPPPGLGQFD